MSDAPAAPRGVSIDQTMQQLAISRPTVWRLLSKGSLRAVKIGRRTVVMQESIDAYWASLPPATFRTPHKKAA